MSDFTSLVKARRSAMKFIPDVHISESELEEIFNLVKFAPSADNLQHTHYVVVNDPDLKDKVYEAAYKQHKVKLSSAAILVLGDTEAYKQVGKLNEGFLNLGMINKQEFDATVEGVTQGNLDSGEQFRRDEAIRNASLSAMLFMLAAKDKGWDTCPMIGFNLEQMRSALDIPKRYEPVLLITIGKEDVSKPRPRGYRKPINEFVNYNTFIAQSDI